MATELTITTVVLPGGKIEISAPELVPGKQVTITIKAEEPQTEKLTIEEHLARANYKGGALFKTAEEVDEYIRNERASWER